MPEQRQTVADLRRLVKKKYPIDPNIPDAELGARVNKNHPEYSQYADLSDPLEAPDTLPADFVLSEAASRGGNIPAQAARFTLEPPQAISPASPGFELDEAAGHDAPDTLPADFFSKQQRAPPPEEHEKSLIEEFSDEAKKISPVEVLKGFGKGALESVYNIGDIATLGLTQLIETPAQKDKRQQFLRASNPSQEFGKTAERVAEFLVPMPGLSEIRAVTGAGMLTSATIRAGRQAADRAVRTFAETGNPKEAAEAATAGALLSALPPLVGEMFGKWALSQYAKVLPPLGKLSKEITESKLLSEGKRDLVNHAPDRSALMGRFNPEVQKAGADLEQAYEQLAENARVQMHPLFQSIAKLLNDKAILPNGQVGNPELYKEGLKMMADITLKLGPVLGDADLPSVWKLRQILDGELFARKLKSNPKTTSDRVKEATVNSLRDAINSQHPSVGEVNARLHFWKTAASVFRAEDAHQDSKEDVFLSAATGAALSEAFGSTCWPTVSSRIKGRIATLLASREGEAAASLATRAVGRAIAQSSRTPD